MMLDRTRSFRRLSRPAMAMVCLVMASTSACTTLFTEMRVIPEAEYDDLDTSKGVYLIETRDRKTIETDRFKVTDNGFLIEAVIVDARRRSVEPYEIRFEDTLSVTRQGNVPPRKRSFTEEVLFDLFVWTL